MAQNDLFTPVGLPLKQIRMLRINKLGLLKHSNATCIQMYKN